MRILVKALIFMSLMGSLTFAQTFCCPERERSVGFGLVWYPPSATSIYISARLWLTPKISLEGVLPAPLIRPVDHWQVKYLRIIDDMCNIKLYIAGTLRLPIGHLNWHTFEASLGVKWCPQELSGWTISAEGGFAASHYLHCAWWSCEWRWSYWAFVSLSLHYYFQTPRRD